jgi:flagellar motor protein MotB
MVIKVKKSSKRKSGKKSQSQEQTVIVNIDKRRRARNPTQDLLKAQALKLQQLQSISQMRTPELNNLNIQLEEFKKEKEASLKREEENKKNQAVKEVQDKQQAFIKEQETQINKFKEEKQKQEKAQVNNDLLQIQEKLRKLQESRNILAQKPKEKEFIQEEEETKEEVLIAPVSVVAPELPKPKKERQTYATVPRVNEFITNLSTIPEELIADVEILRGSQPRVTKKLKQYFLSNSKLPSEELTPVILRESNPK